MGEHQDKKVVVHSTPFIKIIDNLLLIVKFVKSSDHYYYSNHKKKQGKPLVLSLCSLTAKIFLK